MFIYIKHTCSHTLLFYQMGSLLHKSTVAFLFFFFFLNLVPRSLWRVAVNKPWPERVLGDLGHGFLCSFHDTFVLEYTLVSEYPDSCGTRCSSHLEVTYGRDPCGSCSARIQFRTAVPSQSSKGRQSAWSLFRQRGSRTNRDSLSSSASEKRGRASRKERCL